MAKIVYNYRLTDTVQVNEMQVAGINLKKEWTPFLYTMEKLTPFIKSEANPSGLVDYEKKDVESNEVLFKSVPNLKEMPIYSKARLLTMTRIELCDICRDYAIVTTNRVNEFLVKEILEKQVKMANVNPKDFETNVIKTDVEDDVVTTIQDENKEAIKTDSAKSIFDILKKK